MYHTVLVIVITVEAEYRILRLLLQTSIQENTEETKPTMYSDLFDALGGNPNTSSSNNARNSTSDSEEEKPLLSFKAGKVELALQENGKFLATPDTRRCQVNLKYNDDSQLIWEWFDRRKKKVMDTIRITDPVNLERTDVPKSQDADCNDRVYYWKMDSEWRMMWLQDKEEDPELIGKINKILQEPTKPSTADSEGAGEATTGASDPVSARSPSSVSTTTRQVDALSNILENLGMPQGGDQSSKGAVAAAVPVGAAPAGTGGVLTLADLQSAMGGVQTQQENTNPPGLHEVVTPGAISCLLENEDVRNRLMQELPEEQRSPEFLESCLRSPQVQQVRAVPCHVAFRFVSCALRLIHLSFTIVSSMYCMLDPWHEIY
uniref:Pru domain-containing protein n=1 Tax=Pseudo-nitzschia australis TaxID=44445 RepID=A0A7S4A922_9STRA|mmetsp:Transcript_22240/g.46748  ORF Transcript_22240/g.46748 Transcript_22240/m.46748 type:complete len:376 (-) Transcript_22240:1904-3031(-)